MFAVGAVLKPKARVEDDATINTGATANYDSVIPKFVDIAPAVNMA